MSSPVGLPPIPGVGLPGRSSTSGRRPATPAKKKHTKTRDDVIAEARARAGGNWSPTAEALAQQYGEPRPRAPITDYKSNAEKYGTNAAATAEGLAQRAWSPVQQAIAEAQRTRQGAGNVLARGMAGMWPGGMTPQEASKTARYTADGKRISSHQGVENIYDTAYNQHMKDAAQTVFDALNMDAIVSDKTYNVGVRTDNEQVHGSADSLEGQIKRGVNPVRASETLVTNTIMGGLADFQRMSGENPDLYNAMVTRLWSAGLITGELADAGLGGYTAKAGKALTNAMSAVSQLNEQGQATTLDEYIDGLMKARQAALDEAGANQGVQRTYMDPAALKATLKETSQSILGRALTDDEAGKFVDAFHGKQTAAFDAVDAGKDATSPDSGGQAQQFVEDGHETEAGAFRVQGFMERLKQEMGL
jgi:hypothetical protein